FQVSRELVSGFTPNSRLKRWQDANPHCWGSCSSRLGLTEQGIGEIGNLEGLHRVWPRVARLGSGLRQRIFDERPVGSLVVSGADFRGLLRFAASAAVA